MAKALLKHLSDLLWSDPTKTDAHPPGTDRALNSTPCCIVAQRTARPRVTASAACRAYPKVPLHKGNFRVRLQAHQPAGRGWPVNTGLYPVHPFPGPYGPSCTAYLAPHTGALWAPVWGGGHCVRATHHHPQAGEQSCPRTLSTPAWNKPSCYLKSTRNGYC